MIVESGDACFQERTGSSSAAIKKYLATKGPISATLLSRELKKLVANATLLKVTFDPQPSPPFCPFAYPLHLADLSDTLQDTAVVACFQRTHFDRC